jgi:long-subunit fatty acid transport protein
LLAALTCALLTVSPAAGSAVNTFGSGAGASALGGGGMALPQDGGIVFQNPAGLVRLPGENGVMLGYGLVRSEFQEFPDLWWDTNRDGRVDDNDVPLDHQPEYKPGDGLHLAMHRRIGRRFALGAALFWPKDRILELSTFEPELPTYFMYDSRLQRYGLAVGFGWEQIPGLSLGGGVRIIPRARYNITATIDATVVGGGDGQDDVGELVTDITVDVHDMSLDLVTDFAPMASFHWQPGELIPFLSWLQLAGAWRGTTGLPVEVTGDLQANIKVEDIGNLDDVVLPVLLLVELGVYDHYVPEQFTLGGAITPLPWVSLYGELWWTRWSEMQINVTEVVYAHLDSPLFDIDDSNIHEGNVTHFVWRDTISPRFGGVIDLPRIEVDNAARYLQIRLRGGGGIEPTPLVSQSEYTAILDASRLVVAGGFQLEHRDPFQIADVARWSGWFQLHRLGTGSFERQWLGQPTAGYPIEVNDGSTTSIPVGGQLWTAGMQLELDY